VTPAAGKALTLRFSGQPEVSLLSTVTPVQGVWWSNRGDSVDTTLDTPVLDLRGVQQATLRYQIWYDLEDELRLRVCGGIDGRGQTWYAQRTAHTTDADRTARIWGTVTRGRAARRHRRGKGAGLNEQVDLRRYVGKQHIGAVRAGDGRCVQPAGIADRARAGAGDRGLRGQHGGGVAGSGVGTDGDEEAEHWIVQAIVYRANRVSAVLRLPGGSDGQGSLTISGGREPGVAWSRPRRP